MPLIRPRRFASRRMSSLVLFLVLFAFAFFVLRPATPTIPPPTSGSKSTSEKSKEDSDSGTKSTVTNIKDGIKDGIKDTITKGKDTLTKGKDSLTKSILNPFREPSHPPLRQTDDSYKGASWFPDWKWLAVPFSSSVTLDEDRAVLPPLPDRPFIFCYYDSTLKKTSLEKDAESYLLLTWRRAWWAHGFRPIIISPSEAMNNPKYNELQRLEVDPDLKADLMRWLAWETMGAGVLANYTLFPMAPTSDPILTFLRQPEFPKLTMWKGLDNALLVGQGTEVSKVLRGLLDSSSLKTGKSVIDIVGKDAFDVDKTPKSLAYYSPEAIRKNYKVVSEAFDGEKGTGLLRLDDLITAHLHMTWQSQFTGGIEVLKPFPNHTTYMIGASLRLANKLGWCPNSPDPSSCPPNNLRCSPCKESTMALKVTTPPQYRNTSSVFTIGTVPHPWTLATLNYLKETIDANWIRNFAPRDPWLEEITQTVLGSDVSGALRVLRFKQAVADEGAATRAIWVTPETDIAYDIDWQFGFSFHESTDPNFPTMKVFDDSEDKKSKRDKGVDVEGMVEKKDEKDEEPLQKEPEVELHLSAKEMSEKELALFKDARRVVNLDKLTDETRLRASLEAWSMADTEAWKFARAYLARRRKIRSEWEDEEAKYVGGAGSEGGRSSWSRWGDKKD